MHAAEAGGSECIIHRPREVYRDNEIGKRTQTLRLAGAILEEGDWVCVMDADFHVLQCSPEIVRHELAATDRHVATYAVLDGQDILADPKLAPYAATRSVDTEWTCRVRFIYRWTDTLHYGPSHWSVSAEIDGERRWLNGPYRDLEPACDLDAALAVYHRRQDRALVRRNAADGYYRARDLARIETLDGEPVPA